MNLFTKQKQSHRCRKQTYGYQGGKGRREEREKKGKKQKSKIEWKKESGLIPWFGKKTEQMAGTIIQPQETQA